MSQSGILFWFVIGTIIFAALLSWVYDKWKWNDGKCRSTGEDWVYFDTDSCRDRMYITKSGQSCVISWGVDKKSEAVRATQ